MNRFCLPPKRRGGSNEEWLDVRSVVIVGANGSGKSQVGYWIEKSTNFAAVHRVSAQRALSMPDVVPPKPYEQATSELYYGRYEASWNLEQHRSNKINSRWGNNPVTHQLSDYQMVMSTLFADEAKRNRDYSRTARVEIPSMKAPDCNLDNLQRIWADVFPQRELVIGDATIGAKVPGASQTYAGKMMSDGERVAFYLIGQVLCAPAQAIIVIDEPEIHLHRAIQSALWDRIENSRLDCVFVYITHDLDFAETRNRARKVWMKSYDGSNWEWEELEVHPELPEQLLLRVLGSRRPVLFVEGNQNSRDAALYRALFSGKLVIPLSGCERVIESTKALQALGNLHRLETGGLVDRDHRGDDEIAAIKGHGVIVADVAEVENLFCITTAIEAAAKQLKHTNVRDVVEVAKNRVLSELQKGLNAQIMARAIAEIRFRLSGFGPKTRNAGLAIIQQEVENHVKSIDVAATFKQCFDLFQDIVARSDYDAALRYYNCKGITSFVAGALGVNVETYCRMIDGIVQSDPSGILANEMRNKVS